MRHSEHAIQHTPQSFITELFTFYNASKKGIGQQAIVATKLEALIDQYTEENLQFYKDDVLQYIMDIINKNPPVYEDKHEDFSNTMSYILDGYSGSLHKLF